MVHGLPQGAFARMDEGPDANFYLEPRLVTHADEQALAFVTRLYRELFPAGCELLDLMSSWVSHLPEDVEYGMVVGLGMNAEELAANPRLSARIVQDLNRDTRLPFADGAFDAASICVSIQYLTSPVKVLRDLGRVLRPGAPLAITFSNRCFPTKAVAIWQSLDDMGHQRLVQKYLADAGGWRTVEHRAHEPEWGDPMYAVIARRA